MTESERFRRRVLTFRAHSGISDEAIAKGLGIHPTRFSKWLHRRRDVTMPLEALDRFDTFLRELRALIDRTLSAPAAADRGPIDSSATHR